MSPPTHEREFRRTPAPRRCRGPSPSRVWRLASRICLFLLPIVGVVWPAFGLDREDVQSRVEQYEQGVGELQPLCHVILVSLRSIREEAADPASPTDREKAHARQRLSQVEHLREAFRDKADAVNQTRDRAARAADELQEKGEDVADLRSRVSAAAEKAGKYARYVERFYDQAVETYGPPAPAAAGLGQTIALPGPSGSGFQIRGEVSGNLGHSAYKRPSGL